MYKIQNVEYKKHIFNIHKLAKLSIETKSPKTQFFCFVISKKI